MYEKISAESFSALSETMLMTLWAKAVKNGRPDALLHDEAAEHMMARIDYDFSVFEGAKLSQPGCCARAAIIDNEVAHFLSAHPNAVVVQLGAGLDARFERLGKPAITAWYDLDLPEVVALRHMLLPESGNICIGVSLFDESWTARVAAHGKPVLLVAEGVLMYFDLAQVKTLLAQVARTLPGAEMVFDTVPPAVVGRAKHHDALRHIRHSRERPEFKWSSADPAEMEQWLPGLRVIRVTGLSSHCAHRYPLPLRLLYRTAWGRRQLDQRVVHIRLGAAV